jgi:ATP-dependent Clp protease ATP-binding subunit ClpC
VIALDVADLAVIAGRTLGVDPSAALGLLDLAAAQDALAAAAATDGHPAAQAAVLLHALVACPPLPRGHRQVALAATLQFLAINGWDVDAATPGALAAMVAALASGSLGAQDAAAWLAPRLRCRTQAGPGVSPGPGAKEKTMRRRLPRPGKLRRTQARPLRDMFVRFTDRARSAVVLARDEARRLDHGYIGTEHLLLGLIREGEGVAARALAALGPDDLRGQIEEIIGRGDGAPAGHMPFTPQSKAVLQETRQEALRLGHSYIGTEHLLLSLVRENRGVAAKVLARSGVGVAEVQEQVGHLLADAGSPGSPGRWEAVDPDAVVAENQRLHRELDRLRDLLRRHGIDPGDSTARSA